MMLLVQISVNNNCLLAKAMAATRWFNSSVVQEILMLNSKE